MATDNEKNFEDIFIRFGATHERDRQTDRHRMPAIAALCIPSHGNERIEYKLLSLTYNIFTARCYASAVYAVMQCLSVRPSVTFVDHVKTNKHIFEIFPPSGSDTILDFLH